MEPTKNGKSARAEIDALMGGEPDRLAEAQEVFGGTQADPFEDYIESVCADRVEMGSLSPNTVDGYRKVYRDWCGFMEENTDRHPACPTTENVRAYIRNMRDERGLAISTIEQRLAVLRFTFQFFADSSRYRKHPEHYNPIKDGQTTTALPQGEKKSPHPIDIDTYGEIIAGIPHVRDRLWVALQAKYGLRVSEMCNIELSEVALSSPNIEEDYPELGTHEMLEGIENALYIPSNRVGNKSQVARVLPLDKEMRAAILNYLLVRPQSGDPWLVLSDEGHQSDTKAVNRVWKEAFSDYQTTPRYKGVTSHYGRHRFSTYWDKEMNIQSHFVQYLRGDVEPAPKGDDGKLDRGMLNTYVHTYYEDVAEVFIRQTFPLGL